MPVDHPVYPVNLVVAGRRCLVVGGGPVAVHKVRAARGRRRVTVVGPEVDREIVERPRAADVVASSAGRTGGARRRPTGWSVAATGDPAVNQQVFDDGEAAGVWVNSADDPERCTVHLRPGSARAG